MFRNKLTYLGFLGFLGIPFLFVNGLPFIFCLLLGFFDFFFVHKTLSDELAWQNLKNAVLRAAIVNFSLSTLSFTALSVFRAWQLPENALFHFLNSYRAYYVIFWISLVVGSWSMFHFHLKEQVNVDFDEDFGPWQGTANGKAR